MKKPTSGTTDLTTGRPLTRILVFALPLVLGTLFQQLYSCWNSVPSTSGSAKTNMRVSGRPVVRSVVPEVGFFMGGILLKSSSHFTTLVQIFLDVCGRLDKFCALR